MYTHICISKYTQDSLITAFVQPSMSMFGGTNIVQGVFGIADALVIISQHPRASSDS